MVDGLNWKAGAAFVIAAALLAPQAPSGTRSTRAAPDWPALSEESRPWTRWWWMGSAVEPSRLTAELEALRAAGLGGVEITPIYGVSGAEGRFVPYLSEQWVRLLEYTLREAQRIGLGVDMATGTGWPFGGPWVSEREACRTFVYRTWRVEGGNRLAERVRLEQTPFVRAIGNLDGQTVTIANLKQPVEANPNLQALALEQVRYPKPLPLQALVAYSTAGDAIDLSARVTGDGVLDWVAPAGQWTLYGVFLGWHGKLVERAAPGGEGNVIDHFSREAIRHYLARFDQAFAGRPLPGLRAYFNDSYEVDDAQGEADATPLLFSEFQRRRGYDLRRHLQALFATDPTDEGARVRADYRQTISDLLVETFTTEWQSWAERRGAIVRNQAHGSPANLLDLYAASHIPETEGTEPTRAKWATSAAHVAGRPLVSAEAATWLGEHFRSTLAEIRADIDRFFLSGVNHIVYHGTAYSPESEPWPGWLFYASVEFNARNPWWSDFSTLNHYVARTQSFLQAGAADHDVLLYYPFYDSLTGAGDARLMHFGRANQPLERSAFESAAATLQQRGFTYDYISDRQIADLRTAKGRLVTGGGSYKVLIVPASRFVPLETFERILTLVRAGATVLVYRGLPGDVSGHFDLENRRKRFRELRASLRFITAGSVATAKLQSGAVHSGNDLEALLWQAGVSREMLVDSGLQFVRRRYDGGRYYFIANSTDRAIAGWVPLADQAPGAVIFDSMSGRRGGAPARRSRGAMLEVFLTLPPQTSLIVATTSASTGDPFPLFDTAGTPTRIAGPWQMRFVAGGPTLPSARTVPELASWTTFAGDDVKQFSGTALYTATFPGPVEQAAAWRLDLGEARESARVRLNGHDLATLIGPQFHVNVEPSLLSDVNVLEIHVTNLMANRIAALDRAGVRWRKFYNVNFPARFPPNLGADRLFTAANWAPQDSGLIGPVTLTPLTLTQPRP